MVADWFRGLGGSGICIGFWIGGALALMASSRPWPRPAPWSPSDIYQREAPSRLPTVSPDGAWVAYAVKALDRTAADKGITHVWMTSWDGARTVQLTASPKDSESQPRWSPDGRYLAFVSGRGDENEADQLWLLDRSRAARPAKLTEGKQSVDDYAWSPGRPEASP